MTDVSIQHDSVKVESFELRVRNALWLKKWSIARLAKEIGRPRPTVSIAICHGRYAHSSLWLGTAGAGQIARMSGQITEFMITTQYEHSLFAGLTRQDSTQSAIPTRLKPSYSVGFWFTPAAFTWQASTAYAIATPNLAVVKPTTPNGLKYLLTTAGTSGGSEPTWPTTIGDTISDGSCVWTCAGSDGNANIQGIVTGANPVTTATVISLSVAPTSSLTTYRLRMRFDASNVYFSINGGSEVSASLSNLSGVTQMTPLVSILKDNSAGFPLFSIHRFGLYLPL